MMSDFSSWTQTEQEVLLTLVKSLSLEFGIVLITHCLKNKVTWTFFFLSQNSSQVLCQYGTCALSE